MFIDGPKFKEAYMLLEEACMALWSSLDIVPEEEVEPIYREFVNTKLYEDYIKITIKDMLPRDVSTQKGNKEVSISKKSINYHWMSMISYALKDIEVRFNKVLCVIRIFPPGTYWDVDNRAYKPIIDAIRYSKIIPDDRWEYLTFMVEGQPKSADPKVEIFIIKYPEDNLWFLPKNNK